MTSSIVRGGITDYVQVLREYAKVDRSFLKHLNVGSVYDIDFNTAKKALYKSSFYQNGDFTPKGRERLKRILSEIGLSLKASVEDYSKRINFLAKNQDIKDRLDELHELIFYTFGTASNIKKLKPFEELLCKKILGSWSEKSLQDNLSNFDKMDRIFSLINKPLG